MTYSVEEIAGTLKVARQSKQLSQRELSDRVGLAQSHISKIENAMVDLQVSNLIELARALELELLLVPRKVLPAVQSLVRTSKELSQKAKQRSRAELRALTRLQKNSERLQKIQPNLKALHEIQRTVARLQHFQLPDMSVTKMQQAANQMDKFRKASEKLAPYTLDQATISTIQNISSDLSDIRNRAAYSVMVPSLTEQRDEPAYQLKPDDDDG